MVFCVAEEEPAQKKARKLPQFRLGPASDFTSAQLAVASAMLGPKDRGGRPWEVQRGETAQWELMAKFLNDHEEKALFIPIGATEPNATAYAWHCM